jgi:hypothetical protein
LTSFVTKASFPKFLSFLLSQVIEIIQHARRKCTESNVLCHNSSSDDKSV